MGAVTSLRYHLVLVTKYRRKALLGIEESVYRAFRHVEQHSDFNIVDMRVEDGDHIHLVIEASPAYSVAGYVNRIKGYTTRELWLSAPERLKRFYRGKRKLWSGGYFASSIGEGPAHVVHRTPSPFSSAAL